MNVELKTEKSAASSKKARISWQVASPSKIIAWTLLVIIITEWFSFFLQVLLNFSSFDTRDLTPEILIFALSFIFSPFVTLILSIIGKKHHEAMEKFSGYLSLVLLLFTALISWLAYSAYYQIIPMFSGDISDIQPGTDIVGFLGYLNPWPMKFILYMNGLIFYGLAPALFVHATEGKGTVRLGKETRIGALIAGIYLVLRPGSIVDTTLRLSILSTCAVFVWLLFDIFKDKNREVDTTNDKASQSYFLLPQKIPKYTLGGVAIFMSFSISAPSLMMNGLMYNSWVWIFLVISLLLSGISAVKNVMRGNKKLALLIYSGVALLQVLLSMATYDATLLSVEPLMQGLLLFLLGFSPAALQALFSREKPNTFLSHPTRHLWFYWMAVLGTFMPFLLILWTPLSSWIIMALLIFTHVDTMISLYLSKRDSKTFFQYFSREKKQRNSLKIENVDGA
ncbi:MAG: hypothetical protein ACTSYS_05740 [Promethearchaeota archaeon]